MPTVGALGQVSSRFPCVTAWRWKRDKGQISAPPDSLPGVYSSYWGEKAKQVRVKRESKSRLGKEYQVNWEGQAVHTLTWVCASRNSVRSRSCGNIAYDQHILPEFCFIPSPSLSSETSLLYQERRGSGAKETYSDCPIIMMATRDQALAHLGFTCVNLFNPHKKPWAGIPSASHFKYWKLRLRNSE